MIVAIDEKEEVFLVEQYQVWVDKKILVLPRWGINPKESLEWNANKELQEEIWMKANDLKFIKEIHAFPWYVKAKSSLFLWTNLEPSKIDWNEVENLHMHKMPLSSAVEKIMNWEIIDSRTIAWILFVDKYLNN